MNLNKNNLKKIVNVAGIILLIIGMIYKSTFIHNGKYLALFVYFLPIVFLFIYYLNIKIDEFKSYDFFYKLDSIVIFIAAIRAINDLMFLLPYSGHILFLLYSITTVKNIRFRFLSIIMLIPTTYFKVFVWHDYFTWISGMILAMPFIAIYLLRFNPDTQSN